MHNHMHHKFQIKSAAKTRIGFLRHVVFIQIKSKKLRIYFLRGAREAGCGLSTQVQTKGILGSTEATVTTAQHSLKTCYYNASDEAKKS